MKYRMRVANNPSRKFAGAKASFTVSDEIIPVRVFRTVPMAEVRSFAERIGVAVDRKLLDSYGRESVGFDVLPPGLLLTTTSEPLYLSYGRQTVHVDVVQDTVVVTGEVLYEMRGPGYHIAENQDVDLSLFRTRYHLGNDGNMDERPINMDHLSYSFELDFALLNGWIIHQFLKKLFRCNSDPFYVKDGLMHQRHDRNRPIKPEYVVPDAIDFWRVYDSLRVAEMHHDDDYLNIQ